MAEPVLIVSSKAVDSSDVECIHGGHVELNKSQTVLTVNGNPVLVDTLEGSKIPDCPVKDAANPPTKTCRKIDTQIKGYSKVLKVNGKPVLLESSNGTTDGSPTNIWKCKKANQSVLKAD